MERDNYKVYAHINKSNGKIYIGVTGQQASRRWNNGLGYKGCILFDRAISKYGWNGFDHVVLKDGLSRDDAGALERELISKYDSTNPDKGYNCCLDGFSSGKLSDAAKEKIRIANIGKKYSEETKQKHRDAMRMRGWSFSGHARRRAVESRSVSIFQYDMDGAFLKEWKSISDAATNIGVDHQNISRCLLGKSHTCGGFKWSYSGKPIVEPKSARVVCVKQIDKSTGVVVATYCSTEDASNKTGIPKSNICKAYMGERKSAGGFRWERSEYRNNEIKEI